MKTVNITELKARLRAHVQLVRDGEKALVFDRNKLMARIVPRLCEKDRSDPTLRRGR